jgi:hypothetical protein
MGTPHDGVMVGVPLSLFFGKAWITGPSPVMTCGDTAGFVMAALGAAILCGEFPTSFLPLLRYVEDKTG